MYKVFIKTYGCQMNERDSEQVSQMFLDRGGYAMTPKEEEADVILINTCSVREMAENKVWSRVGIVGKHKRAQVDEGRLPGVLGVIGCMAERDGTDMLRKHPQIDLLCGPGELDRVPMLVDNALKYTPDNGEVAVRIRRDGAFAVLEVRDNGIGIPTEDQARVFERFYRVGGEDTEGVTGSGLGLAIVHRIMHRHGGCIVLGTSGLGGASVALDWPP